VIPLIVLGAYLLGSVPFSFVIARLWGVADVRQVGSGNVGATNVMRSAGVLPGLLAFALDVSKGAAAVAVAQRLDGAGWLPALAAVAAVLGHVFPPWLGFRGGKGVATGAGAFLPLCPQASLGGVVAFGIVLAATRYVSLASIFGTLTLLALLVYFGVAPPVFYAGALAAALIIYKHKDNLQRLLRGTERRMGSSK
jgi:glycerol-3-phosphate acyltransferase PlsY